MRKKNCGGGFMSTNLSNDKLSWFEKQSEANAKKPVWNIQAHDASREPISTPDTGMPVAAEVEALDSRAVDQRAAGEQSGSLEGPSGQNQQLDSESKMKADTSTASTKQIQANRLNAQKSTGPKTDRGKTISSQNAQKHGFLSRAIVLKDPDAGESQEEFDEFYAKLRQRFSPYDSLEELYVEKIAVDEWRRRRLLRFENGIISSQYRNKRISEKSNATELVRMFETKAETEQRKVEGSPVLDDLCIPLRPDGILKYESAIEKHLGRHLAFLLELQTRRQARKKRSTAPEGA
jgi:hypothetical protein